MNTYLRYKQTDQLWLSSIPSHWDSKKIKHLFSERVEKGYPDEPLLVSSQNMGVVPKNVYGNRTVEAQKDLHLLKLVRKGDFVISLRAFQGGIEYAYYQGIISPAYTIMINTGEMDSSYFKYLAKSARFIDLLRLCVTGIREGQNIDYRRLKNFKIPVPPRDEQEQIVRFLDWKVSAINRLINVKRKQIKQVGSLKKTIIHRVVTKGLHNVGMKDSGIEWIGNIPENWNVAQVRRCYNVILGKMLSPQPSSMADTWEKYVCAKDVHFDGVSLNDLKSMWFSEAEKKQYQVFDGDLLVVEGGAGAGNSAIVRELEGQKIYVQNSIHIIRPKNQAMLNDYLCYWLTDIVGRGYMNYICNVATIPHFTKDKVMSTMMPIPSVEQQCEIVLYLDEQCAKVDNEITAIKQVCEKLQDLKARLISDVVTGKIDVRGVEVPEYETVEEETGEEETVLAEEEANEQA